jgi:uncharacterized membrane protein YjgN (DUF898 family)
VKKTQIPVAPIVLPPVEALAVLIIQAGVLNVVVMAAAMAETTEEATVVVMAVDTVVVMAVDTVVAMAADTAAVTVVNVAVTAAVMAEEEAAMARVRPKTPASRFQLTSTWCANAFGGWSYQFSSFSPCPSFIHII